MEVNRTCPRCRRAFLDSDEVFVLPVQYVTVNDNGTFVNVYTDEHGNARSDNYHIQIVHVSC